MTLLKKLRKRAICHFGGRDLQRKTFGIGRHLQYSKMVNEFTFRYGFHFCIDPLMFAGTGNRFLV
jgi:hypothetical protein